MPTPGCLSPAVLLLLCASGLAQPPVERNILDNPSFEEVDGKAPVGWAVGPGRAGARITVVDGAGRSGERAVRFENDTPMAPNVFGWIHTTVNLEPGRTYTLSCYAMGAEPGTAWIGTGKDWQFRFALPHSDGWTRVAGTFVADAPQLLIMINTDSPTPGFVVDDVQLERGDKATEFRFERPPAPGDATLELVSADIPSAGTNLIANASLEDANGEVPAGWTWSRRNTDATARLDDTQAHSGKHSLKLTNGTPFGAHVYGLLSRDTPVEVVPDTDYTLSCYYRTADTGIAWIGGGPDWLVRLQAPETGGQWQRATLTFHTGGSQRDFQLLITTESPTAGVWMDDIKLERGPTATPFGQDGAELRPSLSLELSPETAAAEALDLRAWVGVPDALVGAKIAARLFIGGREVAAPATRAETAGLSVLRLRYGLRGDEWGPADLKLAMVAPSGEEVATADGTFTIVSAAQQRLGLARVRAHGRTLRARLDELKAKGLDVAYPLVGVTVIEQFAPWVESDIENRQVPRAREEITELQAVADTCAAELDRVERGELPPVPRYVTSPVTIAGNAFRATVRYPDGLTEQDWPVTFTGYGHFDSVKRDIELMPDYGMNIIQIEFGPNSVLRSEDTVDLTVVNDYLKLLDRAAATGVSVNLLLSPHYFPQWAYDKWPELDTVRGGFNRFSVDSPHTREVLGKFLRAVVPILAAHPALHSFCLSNEPVYRDPSLDPENRRAYNEWLKARYGTVEAAATAHGATYATWDDMPVLHGPDEGKMTRQARYDYCRFNNERFAGWHKWMADVIHEVAPGAKVHAKIMNTVFSVVSTDLGVDPELFCELSDIAGNDCWKYYSHGRGEYASGWIGENAYFDLLRSVKAQPIFNSENHVIPDRDTGPVPPEPIRNIIWQSAIHGEGASTMWVWERASDPKSDFSGSIMHRPACVEAHGRTGLDLLRLGKEVNAFRTAPARVAIVYSIASLNNNGDYERLLYRVYEALCFTGEKIDFITEKQLARGKAAQYALIFAPGVTCLPADAYAGLGAYVAGGGNLVTVGERCLATDDYGRPREFEGEVTHLVERPATGLRADIVPLLDALPGGRPVRVVLAGTDEDAWGVEWLSAEHDGRMLVNMTSYENQPVKVEIRGLAGEGRENLLTAEPSSGSIELTPMEVYLIAGSRG